MIFISEFSLSSVKSRFCGAREDGNHVSLQRKAGPLQSLVNHGDLSDQVIYKWSKKVSVVQRQNVTE